MVVTRNQAASLRETLDSIMIQDYAGFWEVWVADDRSEDITPKILAEYVERYPDKFHAVTIQELTAGANAKKNALASMVEECSGDIICFTEVGCKVKSTWIAGMVKEFEPGIELVAGQAFTDLGQGKPAPLTCIQALECAVSRAAGTASLALRLPLTGTASNLAYRKGFFKLVNSKKSAHRPWAMSYCISEDTFVTTKGAESIKEFWGQHMTWATKSIHYSPKAMVTLSLVFLFLTAICLGAVLSPFSFEIFMATAIAFTAKFVSDFIFIIRGLRIFKQPHLIKWGIPVEFIHAPFTVLAVIFGIAGRFKRK